MARFKTYSRHSVVSLGKTLYALSSAWQSWQAVVNFSHISIKLNLYLDSNILASPEAGRSNCLLQIYRLCRFPASQEDKYKDKNEMKYRNVSSTEKPNHVVQNFVACPSNSTATSLQRAWANVYVILNY